MQDRTTAGDQQPTSHRPKHQRELASKDAPWDNALYRISTSCWPLSVIRRFLFSHEWGAELLHECRNFLHRSSTLLKLRTVALADLGPHAGRDSNGHLVLCSRTRGRIQDSRKLLECQPWATREDLVIFLIGWNAGAAWADRIPHTCTPDKDKPAELQQLPCMRPPDPKRRWRDPTR